MSGRARREVSLLKTSARCDVSKAPEILTFNAKQVHILLHNPHTTTRAVYCLEVPRRPPYPLVLLSASLLASGSACNLVGWPASSLVRCSMLSESLSCDPLLSNLATPKALSAVLDGSMSAGRQAKEAGQACLLLSTFTIVFVTIVVARMRPCHGTGGQPVGALPMAWDAYQLVICTATTAASGPTMHITSQHPPPSMW